MLYSLRSGPIRSTNAYLEPMECQAPKQVLEHIVSVLKETLRRERNVIGVILVG